MLFQSTDFLALMAAVLVSVALARARLLQLIILLLASYVFYLSWDPRYLALILVCTLTAYGAGRGLEAAERAPVRKLVVALAATVSLGLLAGFKYADFFIGTVNRAAAVAGTGGVWPLLRITLPVGISFYTFQSLGYVVDVYRGRVPAERSLLRFALFVAFFPQLVAGPILRGRDFLPQLDQTIALRGEDLRAGSHLFLAGLIKKVIIADNVAPLADQIFARPAGMPSGVIMLGAFAFGAQIYCDFSGYTDMARGAARMLWYDIAINFNHPYSARSLTDFWRRWHITLSTWLRDYLYISLGGNRRGRLRTYRNLMLTMALGGLWHGAGWNFAAWGVFHGLLLVGERALGIGRGGVLGTGRGRVAARWAGWVVCQYFVFLGWLIFRVRDPADLLYCVKKFALFDFNFDVFHLGLGAVNPFLALSLLACFVGSQVWSARVGGLTEALNRARRPVQWAVYVLAGLVLCWLWPDRETAFIYFQF